MSTVSVLGATRLLKMRDALSPGTASAASPTSTARWADAGLVFLFLGLTFLLGVFPLKDADFYWHLKTGDLIRQSGTIPRVDPFTFTRLGAPWIDLHWGFQVAVSAIHALGGVVALNLAKCAVTCVAVGLLVTSRRREWPVRVMVLAWLPALLLLGGRMYVRPETLSLFYLSVVLAVVTRWDHSPRLAWLLPVVQVAWVNSHGLFVFGPVVLTFALVDAITRRGALARERRGWWWTVGPASLATFAACLANPFGLRGALFPLRLAQTMGDPFIRQNVSEMVSIPDFIGRVGFGNLPLQLHLATMLLGAMSFVVPAFWPAGARGRGCVNVFRLLLFLAFSALSLVATRNSHQFAAVVGAVTAWNFGEWAAAVERRRGTVLGALWPRLATAGALGLAVAFVGSGTLYAMTGEGRKVSLGEDPLYYPHDAVAFAGGPSMPGRFLSFSNAHAALYEYAHGPGRKVFIDPRLEVAGPEHFRRYIRLGRDIQADAPGWEAELDAIGRPAVLVDHAENPEIGATLLRSRHWRCVWFDAVAAVFVHESVPAPRVDFAARHFRPAHPGSALNIDAMTASAKALRSYIGAIPPARGDLVRPLASVGLDVAHLIVGRHPDSAEGWKCLGQIELMRDPAGPRTPRYRMPFDPVIDLSPVRATYALRRASGLAPDDFITLMTLEQAYESRLMIEEALPLLDRLVRLTPENRFQADLQPLASAARADYREKVGPTPPETWASTGELDLVISTLLGFGRAGSAADLLEKANPPGKASWETLDRLATIRLHLGQPNRARALWSSVASPPDPPLLAARIGATYLAEGNRGAARIAYLEALSANPTLFEARYGLAVLEEDEGHARVAHGHALQAVESAPNDPSRAAARAIARRAKPFLDVPNPAGAAPRHDAK